MAKLTMDELIDDLNLEVIYKKENIELKKIDVNRPGLQLAGYFKHFANERFQIIGSTEWSYLSDLEPSVMKERLCKYFSYNMPAVIITRGQKIFPEMIEAAKLYGRTILRTQMVTTKFINALTNYIDDKFAPEITVHGVLVETYGMGVLLLGKSGVGKSEAALELIKRGHRLVSDDAVLIRKGEDGTLKGSAPELIRHFMEIRGIGIIDIERLYGVGAVKQWEFINLVIELELWDETKEYDRVGLDEDYLEILGVKVPKLVIPVRPGRNLAMIIEVAARNNRQKLLGYNAAEELNKKLIEHFEQKRDMKES